MQVNIAFGFDVDKPYGEYGISINGQKERERILLAIQKINCLMDKYAVERTYFILGEFLEQAIQQYGNNYVESTFNVSNKYIEIAQHTFSHVIVKRIKTRQDKNVVSKEEFMKDIMKASNCIYKYLRKKPIGLRMPLGYEREITDTNILNIICKAKIKYTSSMLRGQNDSLYAPMKQNRMVRQPFVYKNGVLEIPSHGWQDTAFMGRSSSDSKNDDYPESRDEIIIYYEKLIDDARRLSKRSKRTIYLGLCLHPHAILNYDPELTVLEYLLRMIAMKGNNCVSYKRIMETYKDIYIQ